jgi:hypothetical protein
MVMDGMEDANSALYEQIGYANPSALSTRERWEIQSLGERENGVESEI